MAGKLLDGGELWMAGRRSLVGWRDGGWYKCTYFVKPPNLGGFRIHVAPIGFIRETTVFGGFQIGIRDIVI
jgi:hypothetical protein